ncbi:tRNA 2-thiocytidine(32) synthetase TtcA [Moraxella bovoculi]|uniref:tRNA-cytidine(32) 2-sulfurtransferase n=1 Tax=Moraxella bovoculi 237 TaxID=743974 RepID=A0A066UFF1_9GAMM|nr:tRNA 2-thiocytidine(32) synthetase TtcA [Moraxella bovoculi]AKG15242.2 tRNA 2-thiocytidine biosynthesis protein TtcA [Moraxella bovoculi]KDN25790.1 tRNA 2-thiocytidine biosynthesis protein TtcA [Moraxella bovoculi 237]
MTDSQTLNDDILNQEILNDVDSHSEIVHALSTDSERETDTDGDDEHDFDDGIKSARFKKLQKKLRKEVSWAIRDFNMIEDGDVVMVCISGGKDSFTLLDILLFLKRIAPINFDVVAVNLDQKQPNFPEHVLPQYLSKQGIPHYILEKDTYSIVKSVVPEGKTYCSACSRLRRGSLYGFAKQIGATKIALGHHRDDILATFFLNLFHGGSLKAMPPKLLSDDKQNVLIRPLAYVAEKDIIKYANYKQFPIIPCGLCGSQENLQRAMINDMLREWDNAHPKRLASMFKALQNVAPSQLADRELFDFESLKTERTDDERLFEGDNIQVGVSEKLADIGLPTAPQVQTFNPKFSNKIPTINPVLD